MKRLRRAPEPTSAMPMEPWLEKAVDDKLLIEKSIRVRSSDGSKAVAKAVGYTCAKDSCGMLFPLRVSKQQYDRHLREALEKLADVHGHFCVCSVRSSVNRSAWSLPVIRHVVGNLLEGSWNELCMNKLAAIIRDVQPPLVNLLTSPSAARWRRPMMTTTVRLQPRQAPRHGGRSGAASGGSNAPLCRLAADRAARSGWVRRTARPESWRVLRDGTVQFKMRQWHRHVEVASPRRLGRRDRRHDHRGRG